MQNTTNFITWLTFFSRTLRIMCLASPRSWTRDCSYLFAGMTNSAIIVSTTVFRRELSPQLPHLQPLTHAALIHVSGNTDGEKHFTLAVFFGRQGDKESSVHCIEYVFVVLRHLLISTYHLGNNFIVSQEFLHIEMEVDSKTRICLKLSVMDDVFHAVSLPGQLRRRGVKDGRTELSVSAFSICGKHDP